MSGTTDPNDGTISPTAGLIVPLRFSIEKYL